MSSAIEYREILEDVAANFRVPGGAVAVVKDGELVGQHAWGFANLDDRISMTPDTIMPICSISKQMVCLVYTKLVQNDTDKAFQTVYEKALRQLLPQDIAANEKLTHERLVAMQSGLPDYWTLTVLWGATPTDRFSIYLDAPKALQRVGKFHFPPGEQMSYSNTNFVAVGLAIERATGQTLHDLLETYLFKPAGMKTAALRPDTSRIPGPCVGYEGSEQSGYIAYQNRIEWAGDAGIQASLSDMIAYEKYIDRCTTGKDSVYCSNAEQPHYSNGDEAAYGHGLIHSKVGDIKTIGHSGGLAGFTLYRMYAPDKRTSVISLFNSETKAVREVTPYILKRMYGPEAESKGEIAANDIKIDWAGCYLDEEAAIAVEIKQDLPGEILVSYSAGRDYEKLKLRSGTHASSEMMEIKYDADKLSIDRTKEHRKFTARRVGKANGSPDHTGSYRSEEIDSQMTISGSGKMLYAAFDGYLGSGPQHMMRHLGHLDGKDVWFLSCGRSLDAPPPGRFTVVFSGDGGATISNWSARNIPYKKV